MSESELVMLETAMFLLMNAGLRDTDAWKDAREGLVLQWAELTGRRPLEAWRALTMTGHFRSGGPEPIAAIVSRLMSELEVV